MDVKIKELTERKDILETVRIYIESIREDHSFKPGSYINALNSEEEYEDFEKWRESDKELNNVFGAFIDDDLVGYISTGKTSIDDDEIKGEITGFFVRKGLRKKGIGTKLLTVAADFLKEKGYDTILIYNFKRSSSNEYYRKMGGKVVHREIQEIGDMELEVEVFEFKISDLLSGKKF